jgi:hypothetical protein
MRPKGASEVARSARRAEIGCKAGDAKCRDGGKVHPVIRDLSRVATPELECLSFAPLPSKKAGIPFKQKVGSQSDAGQNDDQQEEVGPQAI